MPTNARRLVTEQLHRGLTVIRCLKSVAILVSPRDSFLPVPFHLFLAQGSYPRGTSIPEGGGASSFLRIFSSATTFGPGEFRNHFKPASLPPPSLFLSFSHSKPLLLHSTCACAKYSICAYGERYITSHVRTVSVRDVRYREHVLGSRSHETRQAYLLIR